MTTAFLALVACTREPVEGPDPMARYADPYRLDGPAYAGCVYTRADAEGHVFEAGAHDDGGHRFYQEYCYVDERPIRRFAWTWVDDKPLAGTEEIWFDDADGYEVVDRTTSYFEGDLLTAAVHTSWSEAFAYDRRARRLSRSFGSAGESDVEDWRWTGWTGTERGDRHDAQGLWRSAATWDALGHPTTIEDAGATTLFLWDGDELAGAEVAYVDGTTGSEHYRYEDGRRTEVERDGELVSVYAWTCE